MAERWRVRAGRASDAETLAAIAAASLPDAWSTRGFRDELRLPIAKLWVVEDARRAVGYLAARHIDADLTILSLAVEPGQRGRGIGADLLETTLDDATRAGALRVHLEVRRSNAGARRFYARHGFLELDTPPRYYPDGEGAIAMTRSIDTTRPLRGDALVRSNSDEGGDNHRLRLAVEGWPGFAPGQFVMLSPGPVAAGCYDPLLPRPMAVYRESGAEEIEILYKVTGRGTRRMAETRPGERLRLVGPLGRPFPPPQSHAVLVGGGTGIASLYELAARTRSPLTVLLGARSADDLMGASDFESLGVPLRVATEDGSQGLRGLVTELLEEELAAHPALTVYACGPTAMMRRCHELAAQRSRFVSLENHMACGFGVCLGCAVPLRRGGFALVCRDGPVFDSDAIAWDAAP